MADHPSKTRWETKNGKKVGIKINLKASRKSRLIFGLLLFALQSFQNIRICIVIEF